MSCWSIAGKEKTESCWQVTGPNGACEDQGDGCFEVTDCSSETTPSVIHGVLHIYDLIGYTYNELLLIADYRETLDDGSTRDISIIGLARFSAIEGNIFGHGIIHAYRTLDSFDPPINPNDARLEAFDCVSGGNFAVKSGDRIWYMRHGFTFEQISVVDDTDAIKWPFALTDYEYWTSRTGTYPEDDPRVIQHTPTSHTNNGSIYNVALWLNISTPYCGNAHTCGEYGSSADAPTGEEIIQAKLSNLLGTYGSNGSYVCCKYDGVGNDPYPRGCINYGWYIPYGPDFYGDITSDTAAQAPVPVNVVLRNYTVAVNIASGEEEYINGYNHLDNTVYCVEDINSPLSTKHLSISTTQFLSIRPGVVIGEGYYIISREQIEEDDRVNSTVVTGGGVWYASTTSIDTADFNVCSTEGHCFSGPAARIYREYKPAGAALGSGVESPLDKDKITLARVPFHGSGEKYQQNYRYVAYGKVAVSIDGLSYIDNLPTFSNRVGAIIGTKCVIPINDHAGSYVYLDTSFDLEENAVPTELVTLC